MPSNPGRPPYIAFNGVFGSGGPTMRLRCRPVSRFADLAATTLLAAVAAPALGAERAFEIAPEHLDCRYSTASPVGQPSAEETPSPAESVLLPDNDVFRPVLADQREPRFYADYRRIHFNSASNSRAEGPGRSSQPAPLPFPAPV